MASKTFTIDAFPQGYFMSWFVTTQAAFTINVKLSDNATTYFNASKTSMNIEPPLAQGAAPIAGTGLSLLVDDPQSDQLQSSINTYNITNNVGGIIGYGYNISIEDQDDEDFNDASISLIAWRTKG